MNSTTTVTQKLNSTSGEAFVPMSEAQMEAAKGGHENLFAPGFNEWVSELISEQVEDPDSIISQILDRFDEIETLNEADWGQAQEDMVSEGVTLPPWEEVDDAIFAGGDGLGM